MRPAAKSPARDRTGLSISIWPGTVRPRIPGANANALIFQVQATAIDAWCWLFSRQRRSTCQQTHRVRASIRANLTRHEPPNTVSIYSYLDAVLMSSVVALDRLLDARRIWRPVRCISYGGPTDRTCHAGCALARWRLAGFGTQRNPFRSPGIGELRLLWPTLARLTSAGERVVLVAPPHRPCPQAWLAAGVDLHHLVIVQARTAMPCGAPNSACAPAVAPRCCAGRDRPTTAPCGDRR